MFDEPDVDGDPDVLDVADREGDLPPSVSCVDERVSDALSLAWSAQPLKPVELIHLGWGIEQIRSPELPARAVVRGSERGGSRVVDAALSLHVTFDSCHRHVTASANTASVCDAKDCAPYKSGFLTSEPPNLPPRPIANLLLPPEATKRPTIRRLSTRSRSLSTQTMMNPCRVTRGEIYTAAARGTYSGKPRPVLVIQDDRFDATASVTVCPFTTSPIEAPLIRIQIEPTPGNGLDRLSSLMIDKITTVPRSGLSERLGRLRDDELVQLNRALMVFLGIASSSQD